MYKFYDNKCNLNNYKILLQQEIERWRYGSMLINIRLKK
jgi:hypothetical protein